MRILFLRLKDRKSLEQRLYCKAHCFPHKLPKTKPVEREMPLPYFKIKYAAP